MVVGKIKAFFDATPKNIDLALAITLTSLGIGTAIVLSKSSSVQIDGNGVNIQRELIETQIERDQAITVIRVYQLTFRTSKCSTKRLPRFLEKRDRRTIDW